MTCHRKYRGEIEVWPCAFLTSALDGNGCSTQRPGRFNPGYETQYSWLQSQSVRVWRRASVLRPPGFDPRFLQQVASRYLLNWKTIIKGLIIFIKWALMCRGHSYGRVGNLFFQAGPICNFTLQLSCLENQLYKWNLPYLMCHNEILYSQWKWLRGNSGSKACLRVQWSYGFV